MEAFTKSLFFEAKPHNVKATSVAPSTVDNEFRDHMTNKKPFSQDEKDKILTPKHQKMSLTLLLVSLIPLQQACQHHSFWKCINNSNIPQM